MKITIGQRLRDYFINMGKMHRMLLPIAFIGLFFTVLVTNFCDYIKGGAKKLVVLMVVLCLFFIGNSFAFPIFNYSNFFVSDNNTSDVYSAEESDIDLSTNSNESIAVNDVAIIEYGDISDTDTVSLEDILDNYDFDESVASNTEDASDLDNHVFEASDWRLILINKQHPIPDDYSFTLGKLSGYMQCDERIIDDLLLMLKDAAKEGVSLVICSPYRDLSKQESLFDRKINMYMSNGYSYMDAYKIASQAVTVPGASEHQVGLAIDIITKNYTVLDEGFENTDAGIWLKEHCQEYGFILRYPRDKEYITSIEYEPWHFRYVGREAANVIMNEGICLEEFWDKWI